MAKIRVARKPAKKEIKLATLQAGWKHYVNEKYYIYYVENGQRKYVGSFTKSQDRGGNVFLAVPPEGWTWKRSAAVSFWSLTQAKTMARALDLWNPKFELAVEITEVTLI